MSLKISGFIYKSLIYFQFIDCYHEFMTYLFENSSILVYPLLPTFNFYQIYTSCLMENFHEVYNEEVNLL